MSENQVKKATRIKLRVDTIDNWKKTTSKPLLEGEIGIAYEPQYNKDRNLYDKTNFQIRVGKEIDGHHYKWIDSPKLHFELDSTQKQEILTEISSQLSSVFVSQNEFLSVMNAIDDDILEMKSKLSSRVTAWVNNISGILYLSEGEKYETINISR